MASSYGWEDVSCGHLFHRASHDTYLVRHRGRGYVYKVFLLGHDEGAEREADLAVHLADHGVGVAAVIPDRSGELVTALRTAEGLRAAVLTELIEGPEGPADFEELGGAIAALHQALDRYHHLPWPTTRGTAGTPAVLHASLARIAASRHLPAPLRHRLLELGEELMAMAASVDWAGQESGLIHGDLHQGNIRWRYGGHKPVFLDWETAGTGPRCADLAAATWSLRSDPAAARVAGAALERGYREVRPGVELSAVLGLHIALRDYWRLAYLLDRNSDEGFGWVLEAVAPQVAECAARWLDGHRDGPSSLLPSAVLSDASSGAGAC
ncbi:phosphotransferase [Streptomyces sp. NPDC006864]|uniref:phosphotransferase enzyme family protein n=1 Tax=Streptomyces sp. NPDC006864 TaxID=3154780 RepID=UPI0034568B05